MNWSPEVDRARSRPYICHPGGLDVRRVTRRRQDFPCLDYLPTPEPVAGWQPPRALRAAIVVAILTLCAWMATWLLP